MSRINIHFDRIQTDASGQDVTTKYQAGPFGSKDVATAALAKIKKQAGVTNAKLTHLDYDDRVKI